MAKVTLNDLSKALGLNEKEPKKDFHYYGTIVDSNPEDNTYQVSINRDTNISVEAARLVGAARGDTVMVTVMANGYATVTGRLGGDLDATDAQRAADDAADVASSAMGTASSALSNAQQANQAATAARTLAEHAEEEAGRAHTAAEQAAEDASSAATSASSANTSAQNAAADASRAAASASSAETDAARASTAATNAESDAASAASNASRAATSASNAETDAASAAASAQNAANDASSAASSASSASTSASNAAASASTAQQEASAATTAANQAKTQAQAAETAANEAKTDANTAKRDAASANAAANGAVASLAITQGVVDALGQDMDDMQTHVAMMDAVGNIPAGLHVVPSSGGYFMVIANNGVYVYDNESVLVAKYGHDISFDSNREHKIGNNTNYIRYYDANNDGVADSIEVVANNIRLGSYSVADKIAEAKQAGTDASNALNTYKTSNDARVKAVEDGLSSTDEDLANYITSQEDVIEDLQNQIDGAIDTWYYSGDPTLSNQPAVAWTTDETKENHLRDLYFNTQNGHSFRFAKEGNTYKWIQIQDADAIKALADAAAAQGTANVKKRVFVAQPTPPYDIGDLWVQGSTGDIKRCATAKTSSQSFAAADWVLASKYTDDTKANAVESDLHTNYYVKSDFSVAPDKIASTISATETTVKTYADNKASTAESNAKTYADNNFDGKGSAASALSDAKDYADDNFDSKGSASAAQVAAISAAAADATSKANAAESNAKADTTNKLKSYYTKTQTDSAITQKADNILSTVSTTYQTKADMDDYSTTAEMNSAIDQKADSITSTVSQTYATKTQAQGYANTAESNAKTAAATDATNKANAAKADAISTASTDATNKANAAKADAISTASTDATNKANAAKQAAINDAASKYYNKTETYTKSEIEQKAGEISLSVAQEEVEKVISIKEASGNIVHVEDASEYPALSLKVNITPKQSGTGTPSPENVRPISGWESVSVTDAGKNLFNNNADEYSRPSDYFICPIKLKQGTTYTATIRLKSGGTAQNGFTVGIAKHGSRYSEFGGFVTIATASTQLPATIQFTTNSDYDDPKIVLYTTPLSSQGVADWLANYEVQLEEGTTATAYEPYNGHTTTTPLGRTVYGGTLDVVSGVLTVDMAMVDLGTLNWTYQSAWASWYTDYVADMKGTNTGTETPNFVSDRFTTIPTNEGLSPQAQGYTGISSTVRGSSGCRILVKNGSTTEPPTGQLVYELATPQTYQLTPTEVKMLLGENNVWADAGDVDLKYASMNSDMNALMNKSNADLKITADGISSEVSKKVGNDEVISKINQSAETVKIQASKVEIDGTAIFNAISDDVEDTIEGYGYQNASQVSTAVTNGVSGKADKTAAVAEEQYIYISKASGTTSVDPYTIWVTESGYKNDTWSTKRPTYNTSYPILFIAKQKKTVSGTVTCTTPIKDDTTTIIDGGHITTGTIDATKVTVTNLNADNITGGTLNIARVPDGALNSNVNVGGRNLVPNSKYVAPDSNTGYVWGRNKQYATVIPGETYTLSLYYNGERMITVDHGYAYAYAIKSDGTKISGDYMTSSASASGRSTRVMDQDVVQLEVYTGGLRNYVAGDVYCVKLEKGNKATDWTPAPEDVASDIEDASKIATDYLTFTDANGLTVGKTGKTERVNIKSSGLNVYDSSDASVAEFGSTARIGKSNSSRFVTNASSLEAYNSSNQKYFEVSANGITFGTNNTVAKTSDIPTKVSDLNNDSGFQNASQVESTVTGKGYQTASQVEATVTGKGYQTSSQVESAITSKGYQNASQVSSTATTAADAAAWSVELETTYINLLENKATIKATVYKYGVKQTDGFTRAWYKNGDVISGQSGESISNVTADALYTCVIT